ncbi:dihydrofolate reductase [Pseudomonas putida]|uniref:dihydrofolate reductase n=1 Tax=Pseudomonas putida TaxID=303 RepID=A0A8I1JG43_PSEPU|nr:dihydrofolate reductase [Pseudomonas putida]
MHNLCLIAAFGNNGQVGLNKQLPWDLPEELKHFKDTTLKSTVIMGRETFQSIGFPLPNRNNIVISSKLTYLPGVTIFRTLDDALESVKSHPRVFVIGGPSLWQEALDKADHLVLSEVNYDGEADVSLPESFFEGVRKDFVIKVVRHKPEFTATFWTRARPV